MLSIFILKFSKRYTLYATGKFKIFSYCPSIHEPKRAFKQFRYMTSSVVGKGDYLNSEWNTHLPNKKKKDIY